MIHYHLILPDVAIDDTEHVMSLFWQAEVLIITLLPEQTWTIMTDNISKSTFAQRINLYVSLKHYRIWLFLSKYKSFLVGLCTDHYKNGNGKYCNIFIS